MVIYYISNQLKALENCEMLQRIANAWIFRWLVPIVNVFRVNLLRCSVYCLVVGVLGGGCSMKG